MDINGYSNGYDIHGYPIVSEEEIKAAKQMVDKDKNLLPRTMHSVNIPKDMTVEHVHEMNLLPGHRIGLEYKEGYIARLSELYVQGYLTEEEYDKRTDWVNAAQTSEQIEVAFLDLQSSLLGLKVKEYLADQTPVNNKSKARFFAPAILGYLIIFFCMSIDIAAGGYWAAAILGAELLIFSAIVTRKYRKMYG